MSSRKLKKALKKAPKIGIIVRDFPTVDSLAAACGLRRIAEFLGRGAEIFYRGEIRDTEILRFVDPPPTRIKSSFDIGEGYGIAIVDAYPKDVDCQIPPLILIGKDRGERVPIKAEFCDVRDCVATSSIVAEHLFNLKAPVDSDLATLLALAIRRESRFLIDLKELDAVIWEKLRGLVDKDQLFNLENPPVDESMMRYLSIAIGNMRRREKEIVTTVGVADPSCLRDVCRYMLRMKGVKAVLAFSLTQEKIHVYAESRGNAQLKQRFEKAFGNWGDVVGTDDYARVEIPIGIFGTIVGEGEGGKILLDSMLDMAYSRFLYP